VSRVASRGTMPTRDPTYRTWVVARTRRRCQRGRGPSYEVRYTWKTLEPTFGHLQPSPGSRRHHEYALARAKAGIARDTISIELNRLRTAMNWAGKPGRMLAGKVPFVWVPPPGRPRDTVLDEGGFAAVFRRTPDAARARDPDCGVPTAQERCSATTSSRPRTRARQSTARVHARGS
jgi:hypothetical protein